MAGQMFIATAAATEEMSSKFDFTYDATLSPFVVSPQQYITTSNRTGVTPVPFRFVCAGTLVFHTATVPATDGDANPSMPILASTPRVLLVQRSASDSMPNRWEVPGGACDDTDISILHAAARELWEEAGLKAKHFIGPLAGVPSYFMSSSGNLICGLRFAVQVEQSEESIDGGRSEPKVRLDPQEHQRFVWANEHEIRVGKVGDIDLVFTSKNTELEILEAFNQFQGKM